MCKYSQVCLFPCCLLCVITQPCLCDLTRCTLYTLYTSLPHSLSLLDHCIGSFCGSGQVCSCAQLSVCFQFLVCTQ